MPYFTAEGRKNLKKYGYHGVDKSLIANYIGQPFWRAAVNYLPMSLAFVFCFLFFLFFCFLFFVFCFLFFVFCFLFFCFLFGFLVCFWLAFCFLFV